jgi:4'-phosphopantetheinyl transferase EntD
LLFSAKESVYKAWYPLTARWLDFEDASVRFHPGTATFTAQLKVTGPRPHGRSLDSFSGHWLIGGGLIVTAIAILEPATVFAPAPSGRPAMARHPA